MTEENLEQVEEAVVEEVVPEPPAPDTEPMSVVIDVLTGLSYRIPSAINELPDVVPTVEEIPAEAEEPVVEETPTE